MLVEVDRPADAMLDDVNQLMSSGFLPGLFSTDEIKTIIQSIKPVAKTDMNRSGANETPGVNHLSVNSKETSRGV